MRENRPYGSEGGEAKAFPTPISTGVAGGEPLSRKAPILPDLAQAAFDLNRLR